MKLPFLKIDMRHQGPHPCPPPSWRTSPSPLSFSTERSLSCFTGVSSVGVILVAEWCSSTHPLEAPTPWSWWDPLTSSEESIEQTCIYVFSSASLAVSSHRHLVPAFGGLRLAKTTIGRNSHALRRFVVT